MSDTVSRSELQAHMDLIESRTETNFAHMDGKLDLMLSRFDSKFDGLTAQYQGLSTEVKSMKNGFWALGALIVAGFAIFATIVVALPVLHLTWRQHPGHCPYGKHTYTASGEALKPPLRP